MSLPTKAELSVATPEAVRKLFRAGEFFRTDTAGFCQGHLQANLLALDKSLAEDFANFCDANQGPLPILYKSEVGQFTAPGITQTDSDVRSDLPAYNVIENGVVTATVKDLLGFKEHLGDYVFFYGGCSYSFDKVLLEAGIPLRNLEDGGGTVSVFTTGVKCHPVGPFRNMMAVSMRAIPRQLVETAFRVTHKLTNCHGAPVHIGNPALIGIADIDEPDYGNLLKFRDGDVPVFWACGITFVEAAKSAKPALAFSHSPGSMYISDTLTGDSQEDGREDATAGIKVIPLVEEPFWASVTSEAVVDKIRRLEVFIAEDLGKRQIGNLVIPGDLLKSALALSHASSVAVTTGFPCFVDNTNPYENDGPPGAIAVAMMLQALGKKVELLADSKLYGPLTAVLGMMLEQNVLDRPIPVVLYPPEGQPDTLETARAFLVTEDDNTAPRYDHLLAIERVGRAEDGAYYTMRAVNVGHLVDGVDWLFVAAADMPTVCTSGIGDGGNELGMGKVKEITHRDIPNGPTIACSVASDFLVTTGVSNWGGYGLAVALYLLSSCPIHERYQRRAVGFPPSKEDRKRFRSALPIIEREEKMLRILISQEFLDSSGTDALSVDQLSFKDVHTKKIAQLLSILDD